MAAALPAPTKTVILGNRSLSFHESGSRHVVRVAARDTHRALTTYEVALANIFVMSINEQNRDLLGPSLEKRFSNLTFAEQQSVVSRNLNEVSIQYLATELCPKEDAEGKVSGFKIVI